MFMTELWKELQEYLSLEFDAEIVEKAGEEPDAVVKFGVSNTASPPQQDRPEIVFENVVLKVGVSPDWHEIALGTIQPSAPYSPGSLSHMNIAAPYPTFPIWSLTSLRRFPQKRFLVPTNVGDSPAVGPHYLSHHTFIFSTTWTYTAG